MKTRRAFAGSDRYVKLAVAEAYRWWINTDYSFLRLTGTIDEKGMPTPENARMSVPVMRVIASAYSVRRNVPKDDKEAHLFAQWLSSKEFAAINHQPFSERYQAIWEGIQGWKGEKDGRKATASAVSKLAWFLNPQDWTIYDQIVVSGVLGRKTSNPAACFLSFYRKLAENWEPAARSVSDCCAKFELSPYFGFRVIDKFLYTQGQMFLMGGAHTVPETDEGEALLPFNLHEKRLHYFLEIFPSKDKEKIIGFSSNIAPILLGKMWYR